MMADERNLLLTMLFTEAGFIFHLCAADQVKGRSDVIPKTRSCSNFSSRS
jgi:hypothetical protein